MTFMIHTNRSNRNIFIPRDTGSPHDGLMAHLSGLGQIARLDFERCAVAGEVIFAIEGDTLPVSQQDEEARIGSLAYALKKLGNAEDAAEFARCLNAICEEGDARYRQVAASHYFNEIAARGTGEVLKEMAFLAMQIASLHPILEATETEFESAGGAPEEDHASHRKSLFDQEVEAIARMIRGRRKSACFVHDEITEWVNDLEANGASVEELDDALLYADALEQYDEGGAILTMSSHDRTVACGRIDPELAAEDPMSSYAQIIGRLGQQPTLNFTHGGTPVVNLSVASNRQKKDAGGEKISIADWFRVTVFGRDAEVITEYAGKGSALAFNGRLLTDSYVDREGQQRTSTYLIADSFEFVPTAKHREEGEDETGEASGEASSENDNSEIPF